MTVNNFRGNVAFPARSISVCFTVIATLKKEERVLPLLSLLVLHLAQLAPQGPTMSSRWVSHACTGTCMCLSPSPRFSPSGFAPILYPTHGTHRMLQGALGVMPFGLSWSLTARLWLSGTARWSLLLASTVFLLWDCQRVGWQNGADILMWGDSNYSCTQWP